MIALPRWLSSKESACQSRRCEFDPWVIKISWRRKWQSTSVFLPRKSHGQRSLVGYSPWGCKESDTTEGLTHTYTETYFFSSSHFNSSCESGWHLTVELGNFFFSFGGALDKGTFYHSRHLRIDVVPWPFPLGTAWLCPFLRPAVVARARECSGPQAESGG